MVQTLVAKKAGWLGGLVPETHPRPSVPACVRSANSLFNARTILILFVVVVHCYFFMGLGGGRNFYTLFHCYFF